MKTLTVYATVDHTEKFTIKVKDSASLTEIEKIAQDRANEMSDNQIFCPSIEVFDESENTIINNS